MALWAIWNDLPDEAVHKSVMSFRKRLTACIKAKGGRLNI